MPGDHLPDDRAGGRADPIASQPAGLGHEYGDLLHSTATTAEILISGRRDRLTPETTTDGGQRWTTHPLPCDGADDPASTTIAAWGPHSLWATCQQTAPGVDPSNSEVVIFRSADTGATWRRATPPGGERDRAVGTGRRATGDIDDWSGGFSWAPRLQVVGPEAAWAVGLGDEDDGDIWRTTDGGVHWTAVLDQQLSRATPRSQEALGFGSLVAISPTAARLSLDRYDFDDRIRVQVATTTDGGHHWQFAELPAPPGIR